MLKYVLLGIGLGILAAALLFIWCALSVGRDD